MNRFILGIILCLAFLSPLGTNALESNPVQQPVQQDTDIDFIQYKEQSVLSRGANHNKSFTVLVTALALIFLCVIRCINASKIERFLFSTVKSFKHRENLIPIQFQSKLFNIPFTKK